MSKERRTLNETKNFISNEFYLMHSKITADLAFRFEDPAPCEKNFALSKMKHLSRNHSHAWWWDSHNSPRQSAWLQTTLGDLDEKTKAMLTVVESDADSFAQRAEIFYRKRPELIGMIEEFYRAYRSLALQYDNLKKNIRQNVPKAVQVQYGLSGEPSPESPFRKQSNALPASVNQGFKKLLRSNENYGSDSDASEVDDPETDSSRSGRSTRSFDQDCVSTISSDSEADSPFREDSESETLKIKEMQATISSLQEEKSKLLKQMTTKNIQTKRLQDEINRLKKEKAFCPEEMSLVVQERSSARKELDTMKVENTRLRNENNVNVWERSVLQAELDISKAENAQLKNKNEANLSQKNAMQNELEAIKAENTKLRNENQVNVQENRVLGGKVNKLEEDNKKLSKQKEVMSAVIGFLNGQAASLARSNARFRNEMCRGNQFVPCTDEKRDFSTTLEAKEKLLSEQNSRIEELQREVSHLTEESKQHQIQLLDRNEEKRAAIRQLCMTLEALSTKNQRLQDALQRSRVGEKEKEWEREREEERSRPTSKIIIKSNASNNTYASRWKKLFFAVLEGRSRATVAL